MNKIITIDLVDIIDEASTRIILDQFEMIKSGVISNFTLKKVNINNKIEEYLYRINQYGFKNNIIVLIVNGNNICTNLLIDKTTVKDLSTNYLWCGVNSKMRIALNQRNISVPTSGIFSEIFNKFKSSSYKKFNFIHICDIQTDYQNTVKFLREASPVDVVVEYVDILINEDAIIHQTVSNPYDIYNECTDTPIIYKMTEKHSKILSTTADAVIRRILN